MTQQSPQDGTVVYDEREAVAVFDNETSLEAAVDALMQIGLRENDMSLLASHKALPEKYRHIPETTQELEDKDDTPHTNFVSSDSRIIGLAALFGVPVYALGAGTAMVVATGGMALIPTIAVVAGTSLVGSALGLLLVRAYGKQHASRIEQELAQGGLLLWVHLSDESGDAQILDILRKNGGRDVHLHTVKRSWGIADTPLHDVNPDPFLETPSKTET